MSDDRANFDELHAACLNAIRSGQHTLESCLAQHAPDDAELRSRLETALLLSANQEIFAPPPGFVNASRARIVERIQTEQSARSKKSPGSWVRLMTIVQSLWRQPRLAATLAITLIFVFAGGLAGKATLAATMAAIPGDPAYPAKQLIEDTRLALMPDEVGDAGIRMTYAGERIGELDGLVSLRRYEFVAQTVQNYEFHLNEAMRLLQVISARNVPEAKRLAADFTTALASHKSHLAGLASTAPSQVLPQVTLALSFSENGLTLVQGVLLQAQDTPLLAYTPTITASLTNTMSASQTGVVTAAPFVTNTGLPAPTGDFALTTSTPLPLIPGGTPSISPEPGDDIPPTTPVVSATATIKPKPTQKPTKTPRALPDPTRRPPRNTPKP